MSFLNRLFSRFKKPGEKTLQKFYFSDFQNVAKIKRGNSFKGHSMITYCRKIENGIELVLDHYYYNNKVSQLYNSVNNKTSTFITFGHHDCLPLWYQAKWINLIAKFNSCQAIYTDEQLEIIINPNSFMVTFKSIEDNIRFNDHYENIRLIKILRHKVAIIRNNVKYSKLSDWATLNIDENGNFILNKGITQNIRHK